jgi:putative salt-induced outer membrane protein YdiY
VDGSIDAGFSFAQANVETHWTVNGTATYRSPRYQVGATVASQLTAREDADSQSRNSLGLNATRSLANHWYTLGWGQLQQNQELSLDLRAVAGAGVGRDLAHTDHHLWSTYVGLAYTHEQFSGEPADQSAEAAVGGQLDFFTPGHEDFRITNSVVSYFNVSGRQRVRLELQSAWRHEFLKDFYWALNGFDSFDSDPPAEQKTNDFGVSFSLGWKF